jgi:phosphoribosylformylglycinamidine synthase
MVFKFCAKVVYCREPYFEMINKPTDTVISRELTDKPAYKIPIAHAEGRYYADEKTIAKLEQNNQIIFRYADQEGQVSQDVNPNGSIQNIAGIANEGFNVFGMMPHPERASSEVLRNTDGRAFFTSIIENAVVI